LRNCLTIDLESIAHRYVTERRYLSETAGRGIVVEDNRRNIDAGYTLLSTRRILQSLAEHEQRITFFVVGEIYDWHPGLIEEIREMGHEVAYHTHTHTPLRSSALLKEEIWKSKRLLEEFKPRGFRAPRATITREYLGELSKHGFVYDSSSYAPFNAHEKIDGIVEVPISTYRLRQGKSLTLPRQLSHTLVGGLEVPFGSGYFISLFSFVRADLVSYFIRKSNARGNPSILCLHPWQLHRNAADSVQRRLLGRLETLPYDLCCSRSFRHLLVNHRFCPMYELIEEMKIL
jgi:peptidoglycan/xylan/chitin deacetylase (PgdA/CDA1 family)